jgi:hypothetical protein
MVAAFPFRDIPGPLWVYPAVFVVIGFMAWAAWRRGPDRRRSRAVAWMIVIGLAVPIPVSLIYMPSVGAFWQGRYALPYFIGILPLCGLLMDEAAFAPAEGRRISRLCGVILALVNIGCVVHVETSELTRFVSVQDSGWVHPSPVILGAIMLAACLLAGVLGTRAFGGRHGSSAVPAPAPAEDRQSVELG